MSTTTTAYENSELKNVIPSGAYTTDQTSGDYVALRGSRLMLFLDVSVSSGGGSIKLQLQIKDPTTGHYFTVWTAAAAVTGSITQKLYYFADGASGGSATEVLGFGLPGATWRVVAAAQNASSLTYSVSAAVLY